MLSLEIIVGLGAVLALLVSAMIGTQLQRRRLAVLREEGRGAKA